MIEHFASPWKSSTGQRSRHRSKRTEGPKINGTGPFIFVEHVKGSDVAGKRNDDISRKGCPISMASRACLRCSRCHANAIQGAQVLRSPRHLAGRARSPGIGHGRQIPHEESSWTLNLLVVFNVEKKPVDDVRVRKALLTGD